MNNSGLDLNNDNNGTVEMDLKNETPYMNIEEDTFYPAVASAPQSQNIDAEETVHSDNEKAKPTMRYFRDFFGIIVMSEKFQMMIIFLITVNSIMMGVGTYDFIEENPDLKLAFEKTDKAFLIIFTVELGMQFMCNGLNLFKDGWLVFDVSIVLLSWAFESMQVIRAFRIFRSFRLVARIGPLKRLVEALLSTMPRMTAIGLLLGLIFYIFAVMFTELFRDAYVEGFTDIDYFSSLDLTLFTLFQMMTLDWATVARQCMKYETWAWFPFVAFVMISAFIVFNLIIAVICDAVAILNENDHLELSDDKVEQKRIDHLKERIHFSVIKHEELQMNFEKLVKELDIYPLEPSSKENLSSHLSQKDSKLWQ